MVARGKNRNSKTLNMKLTDDDLMLIGKYKGRPMKEVPASYLLWWYEDKLETDSYINISLTFKMLKRYITDNLQFLKEKKEVEYNEWKTNNIQQN